MVSMVSPAATVIAVPPSQLQLADDVVLRSTDPVTSQAPERPGPGAAEFTATDVAERGCGACAAAYHESCAPQRRGRGENGDAGENGTSAWRFHGRRSIMIPGDCNMDMGLPRRVRSSRRRRGAARRQPE